MSALPPKADIRRRIHARVAKETERSFRQLSDLQQIQVGEVRILVRGRRLDRGWAIPRAMRLTWGRTYRQRNSIHEGGRQRINLVENVTK